MKTKQECNPEQLFSSYETELLKDWSKIIEAYQGIDGSDENIITFLNEIHTFHQKCNELFPNDKEGLATFFDFFELSISIHNLKLNSIVSKKNVLQTLLTLFAIGRESNSKNHVINQIMSTVAAQFTALIIYKENVKHSIKFSHLLKNLISQVSSALENFWLIGFDKKECINIPTILPSAISEYSLLLTFLLKHSSLQSQIKEAVPLICAEIELAQSLSQQDRELKINTEKSFGVLDELNKFKILGSQSSENPSIKDRDVEEQAAFKYQINKAKYTISEQETVLLSKITKIPVKKLVPIKKEGNDYPPGVLSYTEFCREIAQKIKTKQDENSTGVRNHIPLLRYNLNALQKALFYVQYHSTKYLHTVGPETHLGTRNSEPGAHRTALPSGKILRSTFSNGLGLDSDLKKLEFFLESKTSLANQLKNQAIQLRGSTDNEKADRNQKTVKRLKPKKLISANGENVILQGQLFVPTSLKSKFTLFEENLLDSQARKLIRNMSYITANIQPRLKEYQDNAQYQYERLGTSSCPIRYIEEEYQAVKSEDPIFLYNTILERMKDLNGIGEKSKRPELMRYIEEITLLLKLTEDVHHLVLNKFSSLPLKQYKQIAKIFYIEAYQQLLNACKIHDDFQPNDERALNQVGQMVVNARTAKKVLFNRAKEYLAILHLEILSKEKVLMNLEWQNAESKDKLTAELALLQGQLGKANIQNNTTKINPIHTAIFLERITDLKQALEEIDSKHLEDIIGYRLESLNEIKDHYRKEILTVRKILESAKETVQSLIYMSDHTTALLKGKH